MMNPLFKSALLLVCLTALVACSNEERQEAPAPESEQTQKTTDQAEPTTAGDEAVAEAKRGGEHIETAAEKSVEAAGEAADTAGQKVEETAEQVKESTGAMVDQAQQKTAEALQEGAKKTGAIAMEVAAPEVLTYEAMNGNVTFDHPLHAEALSCAKCHEEMPPQKIAIDKTIAHQLCTGCHRDMGAGPTACNECHVK